MMISKGSWHLVRPRKEGLVWNPTLHIAIICWREGFNRREQVSDIFQFSSNFQVFTKVKWRYKRQRIHWMRINGRGWTSGRAGLTLAARSLRQDSPHLLHKRYECIRITSHFCFFRWVSSAIPNTKPVIIQNGIGQLSMARGSKTET